MKAFLVLLSLIAITFLAGCEGEEGDLQILPVEWEWEMPYPCSNSFVAIWGASGTDVFAVGLGGSIFRFDGAEWQNHSIGPKCAIVDIWGTSAQSVYAAADFWPDDRSAVLHFDGTSWSVFRMFEGERIQGLFGLSDDRLWVVSREHVHSFDGSAWTTEAATPQNNFFRDVWASGSDDVYAIERGYLHHFDGTSWTSEYKQHFANSIWGFGPDDVYVACSFGRIFHFDGNAWTGFQSDSQKHLRNIWGDAPDNVFATGDNAEVLHYDGSAWTAIWIPAWPTVPGDLGFPHYPRISGVWTGADGHAFLCGSNGTIVRFDGSDWVRDYTTVPIAFMDVWAASGSDIFAVGMYGTIFHYNGICWLPQNSGTKNDLDAVWGTSGSDVFAAGRDGNILHYDGTSWTEIYDNPWISFGSVHGSSGTDVFAAGLESFGVVNYYDGQTWESTGLVSTSSVRDVFAFAPDDAWACCSRYLKHYDGTDWTTRFSVEGVFEFCTIWGSAPDNVYAAGYYGKIYRFDGTGWTLQAEMGSNVYDMWGVSGEKIYAAGSSARTYSYHGGQWKISENGMSSEITIHGLNAIPGTIAYACGNSISIIRNGAASVQPPQSMSLCTGYDDLEPGTEYVVTSLVSSGGLPAYAAPLLLRDGSRSYSGKVKARAQTIFCSSVSLDYWIPDHIKNVHIIVVEMGGSVHLAINDRHVASADMKDFDGQVIGGVLVRAEGTMSGNNWIGGLHLSGEIDYFTIGGQELVIDNICLYR